MWHQSALCVGPNLSTGNHSPLSHDSDGVWCEQEINICFHFVKLLEDTAIFHTGIIVIWCPKRHNASSPVDNRLRAENYDVSHMAKEFRQSLAFEIPLVL
jgi:hypothetical protein